MMLPNPISVPQLCRETGVSAIFENAGTSEICFNFGALRRHLEEIFHELASHKGSTKVEGHLMGDHVHICLSIPPKYTVSNVVGYIKGKSAIQIARKFGIRQNNFAGEHFWAREYFVSTVGLDENVVRAYIRNQEEEDERYEQMKLVLG